VLQCVAGRCGAVLKSADLDISCIAECCRVLQGVAVCCRVLQCGIQERRTWYQLSCRVLQCVAECCSVSQSVAVCCGVLRCGIEKRYELGSSHRTWGGQLVKFLKKSLLYLFYIIH